MSPLHRRHANMMAAAALVTVCSAVAQTIPSGWGLITTAEDKTTFWAHTATIRNDGRIASIWVLTDLMRPATAGARPFLSTKVLYSVDCRQSTMARVSFTAFSGRAGSGQVVRSLTLEPHQIQYEPVLPDSNGAVIAEYACNPKSRKRDPLDELAALLPPSSDYASQATPRASRAESQEQLRLLDRSYPNWFGHADSAEFKQWLCRQPYEVQERFKNAMTASATLDVLNMHRVSQGLSPISLVSP